MIIKNLQLKNFRNHKKRQLDFTESVTLVLGPNGAGKTNILEAIYLLATGRSPKARYDRDMIEYESPFCSITANVLSERDENSLEVKIVASDKMNNVSVKKVSINKVPRPVQYMIGMFNAVYFSPQDIDLVIGSPSERRKFIDNILIQTNKQYKKSLSLYNKALRQRNKLLEIINETGQGREQLPYWTNQILSLGKEIQQTRKGLLAFIDLKAKEYIATLDKSQTTSQINYLMNEISPERLQLHAEHELSAKTTLVGPHRDDFEILLNNHNLASFGSRGQQRTGVLSIKLAEVDYFEEQTAERPVLLLDDIFSELDHAHKQRVIEIINKQQTIITSADIPNDILLGNVHIMSIE